MYLPSLFIVISLQSLLRIQTCMYCICVCTVCLCYTSMNNDINRRCKKMWAVGLHWASCHWEGKMLLFSPSLPGQMCEVAFSRGLLCPWEEACQIPCRTSIWRGGGGGVERFWSPLDQTFPYHSLRKKKRLRAIERCPPGERWKCVSSNFHSLFFH